MGRTPIYKRIFDDLSKQISEGQLPAGSRLPTENQLAQQYGVSRITVRHALTDLAEQGYISRIQGSGSLVADWKQTTGLLGLLLSDFDDVFGTELLKGVLLEAKRQGYFVTIQIGYRTPEQEGLCLERLLKMGVRGIICVPLYDAIHYSDQMEQVSRQIPLVFADRKVLGVDAPLICSDNAQGVRQLYGLLKDQGCRRIAFISSNPSSTAVGERLKAFRQICTEEERSLILPNVRIMLPGMAVQENERLDVQEVAAFLSKHPEIQGVIAHTYYVARVVQKAAKQLKRSIPGDLSLVCFDTRREDAQEGKIAYLQQDELAIGGCAVRCLIDMLQDNPPPEVTRIKCKFVDADSYRRPK